MWTVNINYKSTKAITEDLWKRSFWTGLSKRLDLINLFILELKYIFLSYYSHIRCKKIYICEADLNFDPRQFNGEFINYRLFYSFLKDLF